MKAVRVINPGLMTTVQDLGRTGYQQFGVPEAGAMDRLALVLANMLVGNDWGEGALEVTASGPTLEFLNHTAFAVTGADISPALNGVPISNYETIYGAKGDVLSFGSLKSGARAYIAFHGGLDVPKVMNSSSTYLRGKFGGLEGRSLRAGDELKVKGEKIRYFGLRKITSEIIPVYTNHYTARVILGTEEEGFWDEAIETFLKSTYTVTNQWDRMGIRLKGTAIAHKKSADILSSGITLGTIQVPSSGEPIIMLADRQTTGGYTRIGNVISVDIPYLAQLKPGDRLSFEKIRVEEAQAMARKQHSLLEELERKFCEQRKALKGELRAFSVKLGEDKFNLLLQEVE